MLGGEAGGDVEAGFDDTFNPEGMECVACSEVRHVTLHSFVNSIDITVFVSYTGQDVPQKSRNCPYFQRFLTIPKAELPVSFQTKGKI